MATSVEQPQKFVSKLNGTAFVVTADNASQTSVNLGWVFAPGVFQAGEIPENAVISPTLINIQSTNFNLLVLPNRIQLQFLSNDPAIVEEPLLRIMGAYLNSSATVPFTAIGINSDYFVTTECIDDFPAWNAKRFSSAFSAVNSSGVETESARFGAYFSAPFSGFRMKVDIKPVSKILHANPQTNEFYATHPEWMIFSFNFHLDLDPKNGVQPIMPLLLKWKLAATEASGIVAKIQQ